MSAKIPAKPSKDVIYVDVDDEITSIIDKIENAQNKVIALVLPKRAASLQSIVNMKLLKRSADTAGKNPVLITSEAALLPLAGAAGLHVAKNLQSKPEIPDAPTGTAPVVATGRVPVQEMSEDPAEEVNEDDLPGKINYGTTVGALAAAHEAENPETISLDDIDETPAESAVKDAKTPKGKKPKVPNFDRFRMLLGLGILGVIGLIVFIIMAIFVLPKATIAIQTSSEPVSANFTLAASTGTSALDSDKGAIPAKLESTDQTGNQQVTATGSQNNGDRATGSVSMSAKKCSGNPFVTPNDVPAGTGISSGGQNYIIQVSVSFHGTGTDSSGCFLYASDANTDITAQAAGSKYNVSGASFSVAGRSDVSASGSASGGTDDIVTILSQADVNGAKDKLTSGTTGDQFAKEFEKKLSDSGDYVLSSTLKAGEAKITASPAVGQPASTANVSIKITYTVLTIKKSDLSQAIEDKLSGQINKSKQKLNGDFLNDATITVQSQSSPNSANLNINEDTTAVPIINVASVKAQAKGKKVGDIKTVIGNWPGVKNVDVKLSPFWVSKVPTKDGKIKVVLQEIKDNPSRSEP